MIDHIDSLEIELLKMNNEKEQRLKKYLLIQLDDLFV